jgi:hypothetical protein
LKNERGRGTVRERDNLKKKKRKGGRTVRERKRKSLREKKLFKKRMGEGEEE